MGTAAVIEIDSDDEMEVPFAALKPPADDPLDWVSGLLLDDDDLSGFGEGLLDDSVGIQDFLATLEGEKKSARSAAADDDDDDCVILDGDPDKALIVVAPKEEKRPGGSEDELQVLGEKGEVACRDFPHPRHLCAKLPFRNGSHANHCTMCHCYVCDSPAPCPRWGKGSLPTDHCHATDKDGKWNKQRQSLKRKSLAQSNHGSVKKMSLSSTTTPSSQQNAVRQVSVPLPFAPLGITVNQASAGRVPVASNVIQNQQFHPSVRAAQNVVRAVHLPKASAPGTKTPGKPSKRPAAAPTVSATPNGYSLNRAVPNDVPWRPAPSHVLQTGQAAPGSHGPPGSNGLPGRSGLHGLNGAQGSDGAPGQPGLPGRTVTVIHGFPTQRSLAAPVQVRPTAHLQTAQNRVAQLQAAKNRVAHRQPAQNRVAQLQAAQNQMALAQLQVQAAQNIVARVHASRNRAPATGLQACQHTARTAHGTQDPSAIQKSWQAALANLASDLGVADYNINPPLVQQPVSTQSLQQSQLLSQTKASQGGETHRGNTPATAQMRPGLRQLNHKSGDVAVATKTEATQALCVLNSHSSLVPSETYLNSLVAAKPATKQ